MEIDGKQEDDRDPAERDAETLRAQEILDAATPEQLTAATLARLRKALAQGGAWVLVRAEPGQEAELEQRLRSAGRGFQRWWVTTEAARGGDARRESWYVVPASPGDTFARLERVGPVTASLPADPGWGAEDLLRELATAQTDAGGVGRRVVSAAYRPRSHLDSLQWVGAVKEAGRAE